MAAGFDQLTAYTSFEWPVDRTAVVRWNVELLLRWMINGSPPDDYFRAELHEFLRDRAIAGQPIEDSILVYRRGVRKFWEALLDLAGEEDRAVLLAEWDTVWSCLEDCLDLVVDVFAQARRPAGRALDGRRPACPCPVRQAVRAASGHDRRPGACRTAR
ncbi:hypothetical protein AB0D38_05835, partial [Streptomyces sp. NPDC048279]|uniref:hypothetical protein n=1 Tax=Streptomyces sp. NPDC048279 TaxID=3154714 RepID=UPI00342D639C